MSIERIARASNRTVVLYAAKHTPASKLPGQCKASAEMRATINTVRGWLELHATEFVEDSRGRTRRNMVWATYNEDQARALYETLREHFDPAAHRSPQP